MSQGLVERQNLEDIADAIRSKNGSSDTYTPAEMAQAISGIHTADEVVLVQKTVNANGQYNASDDSADGYSGVRVNVPNSYSASDEGKVVSNGDLVAQTSKNINANGTHDTTANNSVVVDVPNSYAAADEGKVVSGGTLVGQTSRNITANGTYDTTKNDEVVVDVSGGGTVQTIPSIFINSGLQISNGWIKGFSYGNSYFQPLNSEDTVLDVDWSKPFEISVSFKYEQANNRGMVLFGSVNGYYHAPSIEISANSAGIWCGYTTNGSSWDNSIYFSSSDGLVLQSDIKYTIKAMYDGTNYIVSIDDGTNIISKSIIVSPHYHSSNYTMCFGGLATSSNHCAKYVQMYLPEMYIKQNGVKIWG